MRNITKDMTKAFLRPKKKKSNKKKLESDSHDKFTFLFTHPPTFLITMINQKFFTRSYESITKVPSKHISTEAARVAQHTHEWAKSLC